MRKSVILLCLLAAVFCQEVIIENYTSAYSSGTEFSKTFQNPSWSSEKDIAIYGWFKINPALSRAEWSTVFHFTSNDANFSNYSKAGDRVLAFFIINNRLHNPTYSLANGNNNNYVDLEFSNADVDQWNFLYVAHGSQSSTQFAYYKLASSGVKQYRMTGVTHNASNFYRIFVGHSVNYKYFQGSLWRLTIHGGAGAYRESGFEALQNITPLTPAAKCITVYTGCGFTGTATEICGRIPKLDVKSIHSIYIPKGKKLTLYGKGDYQGETTVYTQSVECLYVLDF